MNACTYLYVNIIGKMFISIKSVDYNHILLFLWLCDACSERLSEMTISEGRSCNEPRIHICATGVKFSSYTFVFVFVNNINASYLHTNTCGSVKTHVKIPMLLCSSTYIYRYVYLLCYF